ncbi:152_t:CDS:2, partial [Scutellospora calospora]
WVGRLGGVPDMTPEFFLNMEEQDFLTRDSGSIAVLGGLWWRNSEGRGKKFKEKPFIDQVFRGGAPGQVDLYLTILSAQQHDYKWEGFVMNNVLFLKGDGLNVVEMKERICGSFILSLRSLHTIIEIIML